MKKLTLTVLGALSIIYLSASDYIITINQQIVIKNVIQLTIQDTLVEYTLIDDNNKQYCHLQQVYSIVFENDKPINLQLIQTTFDTLDCQIIDVSSEEILYNQNGTKKSIAKKNVYAI